MIILSVRTPQCTPRQVVAARCRPAARPMEIGPSSQHDTKKGDCVFIVNPNGSNGKTGKMWKKLLPKLTTQLSMYNVCEKLTTAPLHAIQLTRQAIQNGAAAVIAVGGDGTLHEVVNGFFEDGKLVQPDASETSEKPSPAALGLIPMGTGSDFTRVFGWDADPMKAVNRIAKGRKQRIDIGRVTYGKERKERYFINVADLHLSAKAGFCAGQHKGLGNFCYVVGALQAFQSHYNRDLRIKVDEGEWQTVSKVTAICVGNSKYFGGGMKIAPSADPSSRDLEVVILRDYKWYDFVLKMAKLYNGTHVDQANVSTIRARSLDVQEIEVEDEYQRTFVQADGEHLGFLNASFSIVPEALNFFS